MYTNIQIGEFYRNGSNRYFKIEDLTDNKIILQEHTFTGPSGKMLSMNRNSFEALYKNKNYELAKSYGYDEVENRWKEKSRCVMTEAAISANRYIV